MPGSPRCGGCFSQACGLLAPTSLADDPLPTYLPSGHRELLIYTLIAPVAEKHVRPVSAVQSTDQPSSRIPGAVGRIHRLAPSVQSLMPLDPTWHCWTPRRRIC